MDKKKIRQKNELHQKHFMGITKDGSEPAGIAGDALATARDTSAKKASAVKSTAAQAAQTMKAASKHKLKRRG